MASVISVTFSGVANGIGDSNTTDQPDPDDDPGVLETVAIIECVLAAVGVFGNSMLFILMRSKRMKRHSFSVYFSFAAVFDSLSISWNCLEDLYEVVNPDSFEEDVASPFSFGCGVLEVFDGWFVTTSAWLMVALSLDRCISICVPRYAEKFCKRIVALVVCIIVAMTMLVASLPWILMKGPSPDEDPNDPVLCSDETGDNDIQEAFLVLLVPVCCVTIFNVLILVKLNKKKAFRYEDSLTEQGRSQNRINRLNVTIFYLLVMTIITWLPLTIVDLYETAYFDWQGHDDEGAVSVHVDYAWHACLVIWLLTFVQNFYLLMILSPVYRREMKQQCLCLPFFNRESPESLDQSDALNYQNLQEDDDV